MIIRVTPRHRRRSVVVSKGEPPAAGAACPLLQPTALTTAKHQQRQIISNNDSTRLRTHLRAVVRHDRKSPIDLQQVFVELSGLDLRSINSTLSTTSCCPSHVVAGSKLLTHLRLNVEVLPRPISLRNLSAHAGFHAERGPAPLGARVVHEVAAVIDQRLLDFCADRRVCFYLACVRRRDGEERPGCEVAVRACSCQQGLFVSSDKIRQRSGRNAIMRITYSPL